MRVVECEANAKCWKYVPPSPRDLRVHSPCRCRVPTCRGARAVGWRHCWMHWRRYWGLGPDKCTSGGAVFPPNLDRGHPPGVRLAVGAPCPQQWEVPRVGTPAAPRRCRQLGYTDRRGRVVPRRKQLGKQPDEAMPSSRGDARAAERARTGGAKTAPRRDQRISEQNRMRLPVDFRG
jgi:hypothetical protein